MIKRTMKRRWFNLETRPSRLFRDRDRDGVANVFDCQPFNRRRQDNRVVGGNIEKIYGKDEEIRDKEWEKFKKTGKIGKVDQRGFRELE